MGAMTSDEVQSIATRLDALGYEIQADDDIVLIFDTRVWWLWPTGEERCVKTPSVVTRHTDSGWRWTLEHPWSGALIVLRWEDADLGDDLLTHLYPSRDIATVIYRSPFDVPFDMAALSADIRPEGVTMGWWQAWHAPSARARMRLAAARLRHGDSRMVQPENRLLELLDRVERRLGRRRRPPFSLQSQ